MHDMTNQPQASTPSAPAGKGFASEKRAAEYLDVSERTVRRWATAGIIPPPVKIGGARRYRWDDLLRVGV